MKVVIILKAEVITPDNEPLILNVYTPSLPQELVRILLTVKVLSDEDWGVPPYGHVTEAIDLVAVLVNPVTCNVAFERVTPVALQNNETSVSTVADVAWSVQVVVVDGFVVAENVVSDAPPVKAIFYIFLILKRII